MKLARPDVFHPRLVLAGCPALPGGQSDDDALVPALAARGLHARWLSWDDPALGAADLVIPRCVAGYAERLAEFRAVIAAPNVLLDTATLDWNSDRRYLLELADRGVPTVPTVVLAPGGRLAEEPAAPVVVGPAVGTGTRRCTERGAAAEHIGRLHRDGRVALVQPYLTEPRTALVFLAGRASHAFTAEGAVDADFSLWDLGAAALDAAAARLDTTAAGFLAARAEVTGGPGAARLLRLNLIGPRLGWLALDAQARAGRLREFALAVESVLQRRGLGPLSHRRP